VRIDFDHNATTRLAPEVRAAMLPCLDELYGNPSSPHAPGRRAREAVEQARKAVAAWIGGSAFGVVFTSGGTEADWLAVAGAARARADRRRVIVSPLEHPAVLSAAGAQGEVIRLGVDGEGRVDLGSLDEALAGGAALVSVALANHELGVIAPIAEIARRAHAAGAWVHTDAVQAAGKLAIAVDELGVDLLSLSAHKLGGPKGVGALWVREGIELALPTGGHQERGRRGGTENLAGIVGLGAAVRLPRDPERVRRLRDRLEAGLVAAGARLHGAAAPRVGNTTNAAFPGVPGELLAMALDLEGVSVATGAACTSGNVDVSPVLLALGMGEPRAREGVRFSLGEDNTDDEVERVLAILPRLVERIRLSA